MTSASWDEPIHLTAGYVALTRHDFRIDPSHPPLVRLLAAAPLLWAGPKAVDTQVIDAARPVNWLGDAYRFAHQFMYVANDADRMLAAARTVVTLLGLLLGVLVFFWVREWLGLLPAAAALTMFTLEPNLMAHSSLITTDLGVTTFIFGTVYFLWRACHRPTLTNAGAAACFGGLAVTSKFSAIVLAPMVVVLLIVAVIRRALSVRAAAAVAALMTVTAVMAIWMVYGFRFLPSESPAWSFDFADTTFGSRNPILAGVVSWVDRHQLLPNAYTQGFLYAQSSAQGMPAFLAGQRSPDGWWYYFPVAFLIKTPIALLLLAACGALVSVRRAGTMGALRLAFIGVPIAVYLAVAMASGINLGVRHILPIYPFILLIAVAGVAALLSVKARWVPVALTVLATIGIAEFARAYPYSLSFFNQLAGGPEKGFRYLADSNLAWGSDLKALKGWMDRHHVEHVNLAYFGQADPGYYGIDCTHLPGAPGFATDAIARPRLPGYVAISPTILHGVYAPPQWRLFYGGFEHLDPVAVVGNSLRVYRIDRWPEAGQAEDVPIEARRTLADALLLGMHWPEPAVLHYREYLRQRPREPDVLLQLGIALAAAGQIDQVVPTLQSAVDIEPDHGRARLTLARALFGSGNLAGAADHAERAARLMPGDPDAQDFLGRVRAAQGRFDDALTHFRAALQIDPSHAAAREHVVRLGADR